MIRALALRSGLLPAALLLAAALHAAPAAPAASAPAASKSGEAKILRVGYQKYGSLIVLKALGHLEKSLAPLGWTVEWKLFQAGPPLLEALNAGSLDFGTTGEAPPIFAQAAGAPFVYVGHEPPSPEGEAILVPKGSPIKDVAGLKGRKVALNKGSNVHYLLVKALEKAGVAYKDVQTVFLPPADARAAFERGSVDAWVIWDPFLGAAQAQTGARTLVDGRGLVSNTQFYLAAEAFAEKEPGTVKAILAAVDLADAHARKHPAEVAKLLAPEIGLDAATLEPIVKRTGTDVEIITDAVVADQQKIADAFLALGLLPKKVVVKEAQWRPAAPVAVGAAEERQTPDRPGE